MDWKKLGLGFLVASSLAFTGCGDDGGGGPDEDSGTPEVDAGPGVDSFYWVDTLAIGREDPSGVAPGFNLDGLNSDDSDPMGCYQPDFTSPDGEEGIDNQLAVLAPTLEGALGEDLDATITDSVDNGDIVILLEVLNVNDFTNDSSVQLNLYLGALPEGVTMPMAGGTFDIDQQSLDAMGDPLVSVSDASIEGGVLTAGPVDLALALSIDASTSLTLNIRNATVEANITETSMSNGLIGGQLNIEELVTTVMEVDDSLPADTIRSVLVSSADLDPVEGEDGVCEAISVAVTFGASEAVKGEVVDTSGGGGTDAGTGGTDAGVGDAG